MDSLQLKFLSRDSAWRQDMPFFHCTAAKEINLRSNDDLCALQDQVRRLGSPVA